MSPFALPRRPIPLLGRTLAVLVVPAVLAVLVSVGAGQAAVAAPRDGTPGSRDFHVACTSRTTGGDGSPAHPWTSLSAVQHHGAFQPGDRILLRRGTACRGRIAPTGSGTRAAPITIGAYGKGYLPRIDGGGTADGTGAVELDDASYWTVQDLRITNAGARNTRVKRAGVLVRSTAPGRRTGIVVRRLLVERVDSTPSAFDNSRMFGGIVVQTVGTGGGFDGTLLQGNTVRNSGRTGIAIYNLAPGGQRDRSARITGNRVEWVRGDSIVMYGVDGGRMDHNVSAHGSNMAPCPEQLCGRMGGPSTANAGIWPAASSRIRIDHNEVYGEHAEAGDGEGIDIDLYAHDIVVEQNYLHDNAGGGVMFCGARDTVVRFNVLQYNRKAAFTFTCGWQQDQLVRDITITNNDVVSGGAHPAWYVVRNIHPHPGTGIRFTNNVVQCSGHCEYTWPTRPSAASNTFIGSRSASEPTGPGTRHGRSPLRAPGSGRTGFGSLSGYHHATGRTPGHGVKLAGKGITDLFGRAVSSGRPVRGAAVR